MSDISANPQKLGYRFPAEWEAHEATWLSFPHNQATWPPPRLAAVQKVFQEFIHWISQSERVHLLIQEANQQDFISSALSKLGTNLDQIQFHICPTNDAWIRDYGPAFLTNAEARKNKVLVNWQFNAWGQKYPNYQADNQVPTYIARSLNIPAYQAPLVIEGGSIEVNGQGTLLTTRICLLHPQRNPQYSETEIEQYLQGYYGIEQVIWLDEGLTGSDTDSHIDEITRFVNPYTVVSTVAQRKSDPHYEILKRNVQTLSQTKLANGQSLQVIELPLPSPLQIDGQVMPASYANFYITNRHVLMPTFGSKEDEQAQEILQHCFPKRQVLGLDSREVIWGLGSFHCLSQQEPAL